MKNSVTFILMIAMMFIAGSTFAQDSMAKKGMDKMAKKEMMSHKTSAQTIKLEQTKGDFNIQVDHEVGFVINISKIDYYALQSLNTLESIFFGKNILEKMLKL